FWTLSLKKWISRTRTKRESHSTVCVCPIDLPVVDWRFEKDIKRKQLLNYSI
uniref:Uncharacterized protein n=1 Tax=Aegilops tauschii subsp. strangulata TaxID=200361 RepID=A0A453KS92_AEGTS